MKPKSKVSNPIHKAVLTLNKSKIFAGVVMILLNIASKFVHIKLTTSQEAYIRKYISGELFIFATCWLGTRDLYVSIGVALLFFIFTTYIFNEDSKIGILPKQDENKLPVKKEELENAIKVLKRDRESKENMEKDELHEYFSLKQK
jgi:hypothetical protein